MTGVTAMKYVSAGTWRLFSSEVEVIIKRLDPAENKVYKNTLHPQLSACVCTVCSSLDQSN